MRMIFPDRYPRQIRNNSDIHGSVDLLDKAIGDPKSALGKLCHRKSDDINLFIDGSAEHRTRVLVKVSRIIGPTAEEADSQRRPHDIEHTFVPGQDLDAERQLGETTWHTGASTDVPQIASGSTDRLRHPLAATSRNHRGRDWMTPQRVGPIPGPFSVLVTGGRI
jgi:hypothetical protein